MSYSNLMVHLDMGIANQRLLKAVGYLAARFNAGVIGVCACKAIPLAYGETYISGDVIEADQGEMSLEAAAAEAEFRAALSPVTKNLSWLAKPGLASISQFIATQARMADLVVTMSGTEGMLDPSRRLNIGELIMNAGRPVLVIPRAAELNQLDRIVVGWKDSPASRRAIVDALPVLKLATHVTVVEFAPDALHSGVADVVEWLSSHGVTANPSIRKATLSTIRDLIAVTSEERADLLVCGAYGRSRLGEWVWGGVTQDLLLEPPLPCLVSH